MLSKAFIFVLISFSFPCLNADIFNSSEAETQVQEVRLDELELFENANPKLVISRVKKQTFLPFSDELPIQVFFSPNGGCEKAIIDLIDSAKKSVIFQAYSFTSEPIAKALVRAVKRLGSDSVLGIFDRSHEKNPKIIHLLATQGVIVLLDFEHAIAHNKYMVIDGEWVETGSYNYSFSAEHKNAENVLIIHDASIAMKYFGNLYLHGEHSKRYKP